MNNFKSVSKEEFDAFLTAYPRKLERDVFGACEPPLVTFNDFEIAPKWPESVVASYKLGGNLSDLQPYNEPDHGWQILDVTKATDCNRRETTRTFAMSIWQAVGGALILAPFAAITVISVKDLGVRDTIIVWTLTLAVCGSIGGGIALIVNG